MIVICNAAPVVHPTTGFSESMRTYESMINPSDHFEFPDYGIYMHWIMKYKSMNKSNAHTPPDVT